jgi:hypothetical protein
MDSGIWPHLARSSVIMLSFRLKMYTNRRLNMNFHGQYDGVSGEMAAPELFHE